MTSDNCLYTIFRDAYYTFNFRAFLEHDGRYGHDVMDEKARMN